MKPKPNPVPAATPSTPQAPLLQTPPLQFRDSAAIGGSADGIDSILSCPKLQAAIINEQKYVASLLDAIVERHVTTCPSKKLAYMCEKYVQKYGKRVELLERADANRKDFETTRWASRVKQFAEKPFLRAASTAFYLFQLLVLVGAIVALIVHSIPQFSDELFPEKSSMWATIEIVISLCFSIDIVIRMSAYVLDESTGRSRIRNFRDFFTIPTNVCDVIGTFVPLLSLINFTNAFTLARLFRVPRMFLTLRHFGPFEDLEETLIRSAKPLIGPIFAVIIFIVFFASALYPFEVGSFDAATKGFFVRPDDCDFTPAHLLGYNTCPRPTSKFLSVLHTTWFILISLLTIGFGDLVPMTTEGRAVASAAIILGQMLMAMPIAIIGHNFTEVVARLKIERSIVKTMLRRDKEYDMCEATSIQRQLGAPAALPALSFLRFMRQALKTNELNFSALSKRSAYFVDSYLRHAAREFADPSNAALTLSLLQKTKLNPFGVKSAGGSSSGANGAAWSTQAPQLVLLHPTIRHSVTLSAAGRRLTIGQSPMCDLQLYSSYVRLRIHRYLHRSSSSASSPSTAIFSSNQLISRGMLREATKCSANKLKLDCAHAVGSVHCTIDFPQVGDDVLHCECVDPYEVILDGKNVVKKSVSLRHGSTLRYSHFEHAAETHFEAFVPFHLGL